MPALRTLGLVILAALAVSIGILGFVYMRAVSDEIAARGAADKVVGACGDVIASPSGSPQTVRVTIPGNYRMRFLDNQIAVDNYLVPEQGFVIEFENNLPELGPGTYELSIRIDENNKLTVQENKLG